MEVVVNGWAVVLAAVSTIVVGSIWYTPKIFGKSWQKLAGKSDKELAKNGVRPMIIAALVSLITAYVLAHVIFLSHEFFKNTYIEAALSTAFWVWLGFIVARMITHDSFEDRPWRLTALNALHELVTLLVMALIIGLLP